MTERDLEARLSEHLHRRYDAIGPSPELLAGVDQVLSTRPGPIGLAGLRAGRREIGWGALLAASVIAAVAVATGGIDVPFGPGAKPTATPGPTFLAADERYFLLIPPTADRPSKADSTLAEDVLSKRVHALGFGSFTSSIDGAIQFALPADGADDGAITAVLSATGDLEIVPLPPEDYGQFGDGPNKAVIGQPLPKDESALFGWNGIASIEADGSPPTSLSMKLKPSAAEAFATYTAAHQGETVAVVIDGRVAMLPTINEPITDGEVILSGEQVSGTFERTAAILIGGMLPEAWQGALVPDLLTLSEAIQAARDSVAVGADAPIESAQLQVIQDTDGTWQSTWVVAFEKPDGIMQVVMPAERGK